MTIEQKMKMLTEKLYDARTPAAERSELSMQVSILRSKMSRGRNVLENMMRASEEEEVGS